MRSVLVILYFMLFCKCQKQHEIKSLYFAYGSNLLESRLLINVPSAVFITPARLPGFRLDFDYYYSTKWRGAPATIVPDSKGVVWGALWAINNSEISALDKQEGVNNGLYVPMYLKVFNKENQEITARIYLLMTKYIPKLRPEDLPLDRRPSNTYLQVIALGAYQCGLPSYYIGYIYRFPTNGRLATDKLNQELGYPFNANMYTNKLIPKKMNLNDELFDY